MGCEKKGFGVEGGRVGGSGVCEKVVEWRGIRNVHVQLMQNPNCPCSSVDKSVGLLIRGSPVRPWPRVYFYKAL